MRWVLPTVAAQAAPMSKRPHPAATCADTRAMSFVSIWITRMSRERACRHVEAGAKPRANTRSTMAAHSVPLPRAIA